MLHLLVGWNHKVVPRGPTSVTIVIYFTSWSFGSVCPAAQLENRIFLL